MKALSDFAKPPQGRDVSEIKPEFEALFLRCRDMFVSEAPVPIADVERLLADLDTIFGLEPNTSVLDGGQDDFSQRYLRHRALAISMLHTLRDTTVVEADSIQGGAVLYFFERLALFFGLDVTSFPPIIDNMRSVFTSAVAKALGRERR